MNDSRHTVKEYDWHATVTLINTRTGDTIDEFDIDDSPPSPCPVCGRHLKILEDRRPIEDEFGDIIEVGEIPAYFCYNCEDVLGVTDEWRDMGIEMEPSRYDSIGERLEKWDDEDE